jgi:hypothetical protein
LLGSRSYRTAAKQIHAGQSVKWVDGTVQNGIFKNKLFDQTRIFQNEISQKESFNNIFYQNRILSEWNISEGIFQSIFSTKPESFRMESFRRNVSENIFSKTETFQKESCKKYF